MAVVAGSVTQLADGLIAMEFRGNVWINCGVQTVEVRVDKEGVVLVYHDLAHCWTAYHNINKRNRRAILRAAGRSD